jgi:DNA repair exonuclease SbcCD ATPase subunit
MSISLIEFLAAGFQLAFKELADQNQKEHQTTRELIMALIDKVNELGLKNDNLITLIQTEKEQVTTAVDALKAEIEALKASIVTLQETVDANNADQQAASDAIDAQLAKVDAASLAVTEIIA